ncbi:MAG: PAS domain-containing protein [Methyloprofundus sp.]|nr:PAS domain-containing protein [Methyloprofundus sp.]
MQGNKNFYWLAGLMLMIAITTMGVVYVVLWQTAVEQKKADLVHIAQSQARLIEAIARFDMRHNRVDWETPIGERGPTSLLSERAGADTFSQIVDAHKRYDGFGVTGEIVIAGIENSQILFLLRHGSEIFEENKSIPFEGELAEPMRRALSNLSGTMIGLDYEGIEVLAAYEPVDVLNLGIVAKINYLEVKQPFIKAGVITSAISFAIILLGGLFFRLLTKPIAKHIVDTENKFKNLVENISEWIWEINLTGDILYSSPQAQKILGFRGEEYTASNLFELVGLADRKKVTVMFQHCIGTQQPLSALECAFIHQQGGQPVYIELNAEPVFDAKHVLIGYRGIGHDISERVAKDQQLQLHQENLELRVRERTEELEQINIEMRNFAYIISHDLRSPLVSITGFIGELEEDIKLIEQSLVGQNMDAELQDAVDERIPESLYFINSATAKMNHLIQSILTLSRAGRREFQFAAVDLNWVVQQSLDSLAYQIEQFNVSVELGELPTLVTDSLAIEQIVSNLLGNALKYLSTERDGLIKIYAEHSAQQTIIHIEDNGRGIAEADLPHIFELFKRVGKQNVTGDGMGLTYVQTLVRRLGGKITCTSTFSVGSQFSFSIMNREQSDANEQ